MHKNEPIPQKHLSEATDVTQVAYYNEVAKHIQGSVDHINCLRSEHFARDCPNRDKQVMARWLQCSSKTRVITQSDL